jgi:hypothetical protein
MLSDAFFGMIFAEASLKISSLDGAMELKIL